MKRIGLVVLFSLLLVAAGIVQAADLTIDPSYPFATVGPQGEQAATHDQIELSPSDKEAVRAGKFKAAICLHQTTVWTKAVTNGIRDTFNDLGIEIVAITDAEMDSQKQTTDIETVLALRPNIIITLPIDPVSAASALRPAIEQGVKIVLLSNLSTGFVHGKDYAAIVTDDLF